MQKSAFESLPPIKALLWLYTALLLVSTIASWGVYLWSGAAYNRPLFTGADQYKDLTNYVGKVSHLRYASATLGTGLPIFTYPAPAAWVYKFLLHAIPDYAVETYLALLGIGVTSFTLVAWRATKPSPGGKTTAAAALLATAFLGFPLWFTADRGNIEGVVWLLVAAGLCFFLRGRSLPGGILIGLAASIKPFSVVYLLLLVRRRQYRDAAVGLATLAVVTLAALTALGPNPVKAYRNLQPGVSLYVARYVRNVVPYEESRFNHSILDGMKSAALTVELGGVHPKTMDSDLEALRIRPGSGDAIQLLVRVYPFIAIVGFALLIAVFFNTPILNQMSALATATTIFPLSASEYTLMQLYVPLGALLIFLVREVAVGHVSVAHSSLRRLLILYALLLAPLSIFSIYAGDVKLVLLLLLLGTLAETPLQSSYFNIAAPLALETS